MARKSGRDMGPSTSQAVTSTAVPTMKTGFLQVSKTTVDPPVRRGSEAGSCVHGSSLRSNLRESESVYIHPVLEQAVAAPAARSRSDTL